MNKEDTVKLISVEGFEFVIDKKAAMGFQTIRKHAYFSSYEENSRYKDVKKKKSLRLSKEKGNRFAYQSQPYV